jgi:hypothetical protein
METEEVSIQDGTSANVEYVPKTEVNVAFEHGFCIGMAVMTIAFAVMILVL